MSTSSVFDLRLVDDRSPGDARRQEARPQPAAGGLCSDHRRPNGPPAFHLGRLVEQAKLRGTIARLAKMNNTIKARDVIALSRAPETIQALIVGRDITGVSAFT